jgi:mRNA interferase RelE/StbE
VGGCRVFIAHSAEREITRVPEAIRSALVRRILALRDEPRPHGSQKLSARDAHRIRQGDYRVVYTIDDAARAVRVVRVAHRSDVYR